MPKKIVAPKHKSAHTGDAPTCKSAQATKTSTVPSQDDKIIAAFGYLWILFIIPLLFKKNNEFVQFHAKQSMLLLYLLLLL